MTSVMSVPCALVACCMHSASVGDLPTVNLFKAKGVIRMKVFDGFFMGEGNYVWKVNMTDEEEKTIRHIVRNHHENDGVVLKPMNVFTVDDLDAIDRAITVAKLKLNNHMESTAYVYEDIDIAIKSEIERLRSISIRIDSLRREMTE